jgi:hypothetical protein
MTTVIPQTTMVLPTGLDLETDVGRVNAHAWALYVRWQGDLGWTVTTVFPDNRLSVKGRKWARYVPHRNRRHYYFPTYEEALQAAKDEVNYHEVNGRTWDKVLWAVAQR